MAELTVLDRLRAGLLAVAGPQQRMPEPRRRAVAIVLSILIAFLLWFTFSLREQYTVVIEMPLEIGRLPEGRALAELPPLEARVTIQGVGMELMRLRRSPPALVLNVRDEVVDVFAAASESARIPTGVSVQSVTPSTVRLALEPEIARSVPVELIMAIDPAPDHDLLGPPRLQPDSVLVIGARSVVFPLERFPTEPLERSGVRETFSVRVALSDTLRRLVRLGVGSVEATVPIATFTEGTRELSVRLAGAPDDAPPVVLLPTRVRATYRVPIDQYEEAERTADFYAFVPYPSVLADTSGAVQPVVQLPPNLVVRDVRLDPRRVRYWLRVE
jgi:hypothetical protein